MLNVLFLFIFIRQTTTRKISNFLLSSNFFFRIHVMNVESLRPLKFRAFLFLDSSIIESTTNRSLRVSESLKIH